MVRNIKYDHNVVVTGSNDGTKQVSKDAWNDGHDEFGMFGHGSPTTLTIATGAIVPISSMHLIDGQGASDDQLDTITNTETADRDELWLIKGVQAITVRDNSVGGGNIFLLNGNTKLLDANIPMRLIRSGTNWYEYAAEGTGTFLDSQFVIQDEGDSTKEWDSSVGGATTSTKTTLAFSQTLNRTITFPDATTTMVGTGIADQLTNTELTSGVFAKITGVGVQTQALDMNTQILQFVDANQSIQNNAGNLLYDVAIGQVHLFRVNNVTEMQLSATALAMQGNSVLQVGFFTSFATNPSDAGTIRLGNAQPMNWRNAGNSANFGITGNASDQIAIDADFNIQGNQIINTGTLTLPTITDTLVGRATIDTFTGAKTFQDDKLLIQNPAATFAYTITAGAIGAARILNLPVILGTDTLATIGLAQSWTAKQTFQDDSIDISNPADTFQYTIQAGAIGADRVLNLPVITGTDTLVVLGLAQTFSALTSLSAGLDLVGTNTDNIQNLIHDQSVSGTDIDFSEDEVQTISISINTTFTTANRATGKSKTLKIVTDGTLRTLTFPAWKFIGTKPADQAASKTGVLTVTCFGTADTDIVAAYAVEA